MLVLALFVPSPAQCFTTAGPVAGIFGLVWLVRHGSEVVGKIFPHWEWERQLGWLNLRAHRRAERALRWIGYFVQAGLAVVLAGILWNAYYLGNFEQWDDPDATGKLLVHLSTLLVCLSLWIVYLATVLAPKIRAEYERDELERFRKENPDTPEKEREVRRPGMGGITIWESPVISSAKRR